MSCTNPQPDSTSQQEREREQEQEQEQETVHPGSDVSVTRMSRASNDL